MFFFLIASISVHSNGIQSLSVKVANSIDKFCNGIGNVRYSIINLTNHSKLSDIELQRFYHLIVSAIERQRNNNFTDLITGFEKDRGIFDLNKINLVSYTVSLKIVNNMGKLGIGIAVYNRNTENIVFIKYFEESVNLKEIELLGTENSRIGKYEYKKSYEIKVTKDLLDVSSLKNKDKSDNIFFLFSRKIDIYNLRDNNLKKINSIRIEWGRPYYPAIKSEGKLFVYSNKEEIFIFAGINSSPISLIFSYKNGNIKQIGKLKFVVTSIMLINGQKYLSGFKYSLGKNFFRGNLFLKTFNEMSLESGEVFKKNLPEFYSAILMKDDLIFSGLYLIDKNYKLHVYSGNMDEVANSDRRYGSTLSIKNKFVGISDYLRGNDNFMIVKNENGIDKPIHTIPINGEIKFIKGGEFGGYSGFWILKSEKKGNYKDYKLQFRRKNID